MTKLKNIVLLLITLLLIVVFPNTAKAATEYTYSDTEQGIEWSYELDESENVVNLRCKTTTVTGEITIPATINGKTVISLNGSYGKGAFENCVGLTGITIPDTITKIGQYAFYKCAGLSTVNIPNSVTYIGSHAFSGCSGLRSITLAENLITIEKYAFSSCPGLKSITIPNSVISIEERAFSGCSGLKEVKLSENLTKISTATFMECSGITSIVIPDSVTTIAGGYYYEGAFNGCKNLGKILIPDNVVSIAEDTFRDCDKLTIYGNDGMKSKEYAEANGINFKYISEWNDTDVGDDITPPTVESLKITYDSVAGYMDSNTGMFMVPEGANVVIKANFSETIQGTIVPTLTIKFGTGENIEIKEGTIGGSTITYVYTIQNTDNGTMTAVSFAGGDIKDATENSATLSCPELKVEVFGGLLYANGTITNLDNGDNSNDGTNEGSGTGTDTGNGTENTDKNHSTQKTTTEDKKDTTTATTVLPAAGINMTIVSIIIGAIIVAVITIKKYNSYRDIK